MEIRERVLLKPFTTFRMGGPASFFTELHSLEEIIEYSHFAESKKLPLIVLGGGSNAIFPDGTLNACVGHMQVKGFEILSQDSHGVSIKIGAGEEWDDVVEKCIALGLSGIEALSAIPGSAGGTPIQNVGAYGQEIADVLVGLEAYDVSKRAVVQIPASECGFSYRDSIFRREGAGKYVILSITLRLSKENPILSTHADLRLYFEERGIESPTLEQIRERVIEVRKRKLPDPQNIASCGSFFKNPIVSAEKAQKIREKYPQTVMYSAPDGKMKLGAGSMIDILGLKGREFGNIAVYSHNALVLVNKGGATRAEVERTAEYIEKEIGGAFGVSLEREPVFF